MSTEAGEWCCTEVDWAFRADLSLQGGPNQGRWIAATQLTQSVRSYNWTCAFHFSHLGGFNLKWHRMHRRATVMLKHTFIMAKIWPSWPASQSLPLVSHLSPFPSVSLSADIKEQKPVTASEVPKMYAAWWCLHSCLYFVFLPVFLFCFFLGC